MQQSLPISQISEIHMQQTFHVLQYLDVIVLIKVECVACHSINSLVQNLSIWPTMQLVDSMFICMVCSFTRQVTFCGVDMYAVWWWSVATLCPLCILTVTCFPVYTDTGTRAKWPTWDHHYHKSPWKSTGSQTKWAQKGTNQVWAGQGTTEMRYNVGRHRTPGRHTK